MSLTFESPTQGGSQTKDAYFTPLNAPTLLSSTENASNNNDPLIATTPYYTAPINPVLHQEFLNAIQARQALQPTVLSPSSEQKHNLTLSSLASRRQKPQPSQPVGSFPHITPLNSEQLNELLTRYNQNSNNIIILDVRSFVQFSYSRIRSSINISVPNTILKRPTFTLDKVYEAIVDDKARKKLQGWQAADYIVFYDQQSQLIQENSACAYLSAKLIKLGFKGKLHYLKGGFDSFFDQYKDQVESSSMSPTTLPMNGSMPAGPPTTIGSLNLNNSGSRRPNLRLNNLPVSTPKLGPFTAPMPHFSNQTFNPFFSNIRQNMELSHGPIRERFPIRLPPKCSVDQTIDGSIQILKDGAGQRFDPPAWLQKTVKEDGPKLMAENYEKLERTEQRRLQNIMHFHSKHSRNPEDFPFSIVAGIEMGALNRYTNIWPYEYTRVKIKECQTSDYINASYVQYMEGEEIAPDAQPESISMEFVNKMKENPETLPYRRYISTQGPLPATFNDFWQVLWEQNSRVLVMLTKEEEMNKIKCHRYWPATLNEATQYGKITVTLTSESYHHVKSPDKTIEDAIVMRQLMVSKNGDSRSVTHLQYIGWMDFGVPDNPLGTLQIIQMANESQQKHSKPSATGPMIVHCSAGCGRSGAFCAIDTTLYRLSRLDCSDESSDVLLQTISRFREQRLSMVQTLRQFVFCYEAVWWWLLGYGRGKSVSENQDMDTFL